MLHFEVISHDTLIKHDLFQLVSFVVIYSLALFCYFKVVYLIYLFLYIFINMSIYLGYIVKLGYIINTIHANI